VALFTAFQMIKGCVSAFWATHNIRLSSKTPRNQRRNRKFTDRTKALSHRELEKIKVRKKNIPTILHDCIILHELLQEFC
jgi:hypothetical protein